MSDIQSPTSTQPTSTPTSTTTASSSSPSSSSSSSQQQQQQQPSAAAPLGPPRKRTKVSRACDECRRKKIRCDANPDEGILQCSSCKRTGDKCSFCRIPMKRGPSKGQRRDSCSSIKLQHPQSSSPSSTSPFLNQQQYPGLKPYSPISLRPIPHGQQHRLPSIDFLTRNHPSSSSSSPSWQHQQHQQQNQSHHFNNLQYPTTAPPNYQPHPSLLPNGSPGAAPSSYEDQPLRSGHSSRSNSVPSYLPSEVAESKKLYPAPAASPPSPNCPASPELSPRSSGPDPHIFASATSPTAVQPPPGHHWQDRQIDSYYQIIHPTLPILPSSKIRLREFLAACPNSSLRDALLSGLNGLAKKMSDHGAATSAHKPQLLNAVWDLAESSGGLIADQLPYESRSLYLVCLIFLFLYTDESMWLASAVSIAYSMDLHITTDTAHETGSRRLFLVLVILDSMNSAVKNLPPFIPQSLVHFDEDRDALCFGSRTGVEILKLCIVLRNVSNVKQQPRGSLNPAYLDTLNFELDAVKNNIEGLWDTVPILKALYLSVLVNLYSLHLTSNDATVLNNICAKMMATLTELSFLMVSPLISVSPLMGYFYQLICDGACKVITVLPRIQAAPATSSPVIREQALSLLEFLHTSAGPAHAKSLNKMDSLLRGQQQQQQQQQQRKHNTKGPASPPTSPSSLQAKSPDSTSTATSTQSVTYMYDQTTGPQTQQPKPALLRGIMMATSHSGLDKLANVAEKVKLFI